MANSRTLHLTSMWSLEDQGIPEIRDKLKALNPGASIKVEYQRDKHILVVTGQFNEEFDVKITSLLANYIEEHRNDDLLETTRIRQLPISTFFDPNPFPSHESDALPETETLVEDIAPAQPTSDGLIVKFWYPSQMGTGPISHDSDALLLRISKMTKTQITVEGARGLRISAQYMNNIDEAMDILDCLEECLDLIENTNRGLIVFTPQQEDATFRIMTYAQISTTALWRILIDLNASLRLPKIMTLVVCEFDESANQYCPLRKLRQPPQVAQKASIIRDWEDYHFPEIGPRNDPFLGDIDQHIAPKGEALYERNDTKHPYLSTGKAKDVDKWISRGVTKRPMASNIHTRASLEDDTTSPTLVKSKLQPAPSVSAPREKRQSVPFKPNPAGVKGRVIMLQDGTVPINQSQQEKPDTPHSPNISLFGRLSYRERIREQQVAGSSISVPQQKGLASIVRSAADFTASNAVSKQPETMSEATGPVASISTRESDSNATPRRPVLSTHPGTAPKQPGKRPMIWLSLPLTEKRS